MRWLLAALLVLGLTGAAFPPRGGGGTSTPPPSGIALTRTIMQPSGSTTPAIAMRMLGQPFKGGPDFTADEVPAGDIVTGTLAGHPIRVAECDQGGPMLHATARGGQSTRWMRLLIDYSVDTSTGLPITITPSNTTGATLQFTAVPGSWTTGRSYAASDADWQALGDQVTLQNVTTTIGGIAGTSGTGFDSPSGTWTASFNSSARIVHVCSSPVGNITIVVASFINPSGPTTHTALVAVMEYWNSELSGGSAGPIYSRGPFIWNTFLDKVTGGGITCSGTRTKCPSSVQADVAWTRGGSCPRTYGLCSWSKMGIWAMTAALMTRPDADWDCWYISASCTASGANSADNTASWVWEDYTKVRATHTIPPIADNIPTYFKPNSGAQSDTITNPTTTVTAYNSGTGIFTLTDPQAVTSTLANGTGNKPAASAIEFSAVTGLTGISANTPYFPCWPVVLGTMPNQYTDPTKIALYADQVDALACTSTGQIIPTGSLSGTPTVQIDVAPEATNIINTAQGSAGAHPDLFPIPEWGNAYLVAPITPSNGSTWDAYHARRVARISAWLDWSVPQQVLNDSTLTILSMLSSADNTSCCSSLPNMMGGTGLGTPDYITYANATAYPAAINNSQGPTGGLGIFAGAFGCQNFNPANGGFKDCGDINRQHYTGVSQWPVELLEGDPLMQLSIEIQGNRGLSDTATDGTAVISGTTYFPLYLNSGVTRASNHATWNIPVAEYFAPEGSAEQAYWRKVNAVNLAATNAFLALQSANYQALALVPHNPTEWGTFNFTSSTSPNDVWQSWQPGYSIWGETFEIALNGEFEPSFVTFFQNQTTSTLYSAAIGLAAPGTTPATTPCLYYADAYFLFPGLNNVGDSKPGTYISNLNDMTDGARSGGAGDYQQGPAKFTNGSADITSNLGAGWYVTFGGNNPAVGDLVRFYNWDSDGTSYAGVPSPFALATDYYVVSVTANTSFQVSATFGGSPIVAGGNGSAETTFLPGPNAPTCPSTGGSASNTGVVYYYIQDLTGQAAGIAALQAVGAINISGHYGLSNPALTAYNNMKARWTAGGIPSQCNVVGYNCLQPTW